MSKSFEILKFICLILMFSGFFTSVQAQSAIEIEDIRSVASAPSHYNRHFKRSFRNLSTLGIPEGGSEYYTVLGFRGWGDNTGGKAHELAFGNGNDVFLRSGIDEGWQLWRKIIVENPGTECPPDELQLASLN